MERPGLQSLGGQRDDAQDQGDGESDRGVTNLSSQTSGHLADCGVICVTGDRLLFGFCGEVIIEPILWEQLGDGTYREFEYLSTKGGGKAYG